MVLRQGLPRTSLVGESRKSQQSWAIPGLCVLLQNLDLFSEALAEHTGVYPISAFQLQEIPLVLFGAWIQSQISSSGERKDRGLVLACHFTSEGKKGGQKLLPPESKTEQCKSHRLPPCSQSPLKSLGLWYRTSLSPTQKTRFLTKTAF